MMMKNENNISRRLYDVNPRVFISLGKSPIMQLLDDFFNNLSRCLYLENAGDMQCSPNS